MAAFSRFLAGLLDEGKVIFRAGEIPRDRPADRDIPVLAEAFSTFALGVGGPPIALDARCACEAAEVVRQACWALVDRGERPEDLGRRLRMTTGPSAPAQHLSADLLLRYLPQILKRARGLDPTDPLVGILGEILRRWPLSGALSDIEEGPLTPIDFGGHPGLLLLYAERVAAHDRPAWRPEPSGAPYDYYELVSGSKPSNPGIPG